MVAVSVLCRLLLFEILITARWRCRKLCNCSPPVLLQVKNALNGTTGPSLILLVSILNCAFHEKDDQEGDAAAKKDWGTTFRFLLASLGVICQCLLCD
jgi:hypothetical protein